MAFKRDKQPSNSGFKRDPKKGLFQQPGGLADYLPEGVTNAMQGFDDITQSAGAVVSRGWGDDEKATEEARARTTHTPTDIIAGIAGAPYRIGSTLAGGAWGAAEGAASSYGDQEGWVPEWGNIGRDALAGAALGSGGYMLPGVWNAAKSGLKKVGAVPKLVTVGLDSMLGGPYTTATSGVAGAASKVMPTLPKGQASRDILAKTFTNFGRQ